MIKKKDFIISVVMILLSIYYYNLTNQLPQRATGFGAGFFPNILAYALVVCSLILIAITYFNRDEAAEIKIDLSAIDYKILFKKISVILILTLYTYSLFYFGFKIPTFFFLALMMIVYGEKKLSRILLMGICFTVFYDVLFRQLFRVPFRELRIFQQIWRQISTIF